MILMMADLIYFPLYCIERFAIQKFGILRFDSFLLNVIVGVLNTFFMLIFNEILECNFFGLNKDLKRNINIRQDIDYKYKSLDRISLDDESEQGRDSENNSKERESNGRESENNKKLEINNNTIFYNMIYSDNN